MERERIFAGLTGEDVNNIIRQGEVVHFATGKVIFRQGTEGNKLYVVLSGEIGIYLGNDAIARCVKGDAFGEMAVLNHRPRVATAVALSNCRLLTLDESQMNRILEQHVAVRVLLNIIHILCERLEYADSKVLNLKKQLDTEHQLLVSADEHEMAQEALRQHEESSSVEA